MSTDTPELSLPARETAHAPAAAKDRPVLLRALGATWHVFMRVTSSVADAMDPAEEVLGGDATSTGHVGIEARRNRQI